MNGRIYADEQGLECLFLANNGLPGHVAGTSAIPLTADIRVPKSAFWRNTSASPPQQQTFLVVSPKVRSWLRSEVPATSNSRPVYPQHQT